MALLRVEVILFINSTATAAAIQKKKKNQNVAVIIRWEQFEYILKTDYVCSGANRRKGLQ